MRALQIAELDGPDALKVVDAPEPEASHAARPGEGVVVDVKAAAVSFPDVLQCRGLYQFKPDLPFVPGAEVGGLVVSAGRLGARAGRPRGGVHRCWAAMAEARRRPPAFMTFALPDELDFAQGAALILNYHTALFRAEATAAG